MYGSADHKQRLVKLNRLTVLAKNRHDRAGDIGLNRVKHFHCLNDGQGVTLLNRLTNTTNTGLSGAGEV